MQEGAEVWTLIPLEFSLETLFLDFIKQLIWTYLPQGLLVTLKVPISVSGDKSPTSNAVDSVK